MYKKNKSVKLQLKHLNDCYDVFEHHANNQNIAGENRKDYINLLLKNYMNSDDTISNEEIQEAKKFKTKDDNDW